jgi:hypothetical protein
MIDEDMTIDDPTVLDRVKENLEYSDVPLLEKKAHPWRRCSIGKHLVREHPVHVPPSKNHPGGVVTTWHEHCATNPSHKEELSYAEIQYITETYFVDLSGPPTAGVLTEYPNADKFDQQIRGWVRYWNDIFQPSDPLDPNLIKALIATESGFNPKPKKKNGAHGLMQLLSLTFRALHDTKGELNDYLIRMTQDELLNPSANICSGVRWLFWKQVLASKRLKRTASWEEAIIEYKGYWDIIKKGEIPLAIKHLRVFYKRLQGK